MRVRNFSNLIILILVCQLAGVIGSIFTFPSITAWYVPLEKPWFTPPNWIFGPVWITLYTLMGISAYIVLEKGWKKRDVRRSMYLFTSQLVLNAVWPVLFFGFKQLMISFAEIIALWLVIAATIYKFWNIDRRAAWLLVPYIAWVTLASSLNYYVWILN
jgi:benzodiazapine receptor